MLPTVQLTVPSQMMSYSFERANYLIMSTGSHASDYLVSSKEPGMISVYARSVLF